MWISCLDTFISKSLSIHRQSQLVYTTLWLLTDKKSEYLPRRPFPLLPAFRLPRPFLRHICKASPRGRRRRTQPKNAVWDGQRCHGRTLTIFGVSGFRDAKAFLLVHDLRWKRQAGTQVYMCETETVPLLQKTLRVPLNVGVRDSFGMRPQFPSPEGAGGEGATSAFSLS